MMKHLRITGIVMGLTLGATMSWAAAPATSPTNAPAPPPPSKTVGIHVVTRTVNPNKTITLLYRWNDNKLNQPVERSVVLNEDTVIGIHGELKKLSDVTDEAVREASVATVGPDNVTAVLLRIGRQMIKVSRDDLTPKQVAALEAAAPRPTAASDAALEKRVAGMVAELKLNEPAREARVRDILTANLKAVRNSHNAGFAPAKLVRQNLNAGLNTNLTAAQVESVKDTLTHGVVKRTFDSYHRIVPQLTAEDDKVILGLLQQAREEALDVKNADELGPVFEPYKKQIEQYITAHGHDWKQAYKAFVNAQKAGQTPPATQPAANPAQ